MPPLSLILYDGQFYDEIFSPEFFGALAELMGIEWTEENFNALRSGHYLAFKAYTVGQYEQRQFFSLKAENARLKQVAKDAERLIVSLGALYEFGQTNTNLAKEIQSNPMHHVAPNGLTLAVMQSTERPEDPLYDFREFISDLWVSAKRAIISKPKAPVQLGENFDLKTVEALVLAKDYNSTGDHAADLARWRERSAAHKLNNDHAICRFIETFGPVWTKLSPIPFTQGHYYEKIGHEPSRTVAALKLSFSCHVPNVSTQNIVTAIRKKQSPM
jgi:hypothetical protein